MMTKRSFKTLPGGNLPVSVWVEGKLHSSRVEPFSPIDTPFLFDPERKPSGGRMRKLPARSFSASMSSTICLSSLLPLQALSRKADRSVVVRVNAASNTCSVHFCQSAIVSFHQATGRLADPHRSFAELSARERCSQRDQP